MIRVRCENCGELVANGEEHQCPAADGEAAAAKKKEERRIWMRLYMRRYRERARSEARR
jgi:hypothetical protein